MPPPEMRWQHSRLNFTAETFHEEEYYNKNEYPDMNEER